MERADEKQESLKFFERCSGSNLGGAPIYYSSSTYSTLQFAQPQSAGLGTDYQTDPGVLLGWAGKDKGLKS